MCVRSCVHANACESTHEFMHMYMNVCMTVCTVKSGALTAGPLTTDDVNMVYGTAASSEFSPFIVSPDPDRPVSRSLKGR